MQMIQIGMDEALQLEREGKEKQYDAFREKFKPKKTTDDCYTPERIYDAVAGWVAREFQLDPACFMRPFWPGGDYQNETYPDGCVVVDNPPFSIMVEILRFYLARRVRFFLFAPALTLFAGRGLEVCYMPVGVSVTYANGAEVPTSFITNLDTVNRVRTCPELYRAVDTANTENLREGKKELPKYSFPDNIITAAMAQRWCKYGVEFRLPGSECTQVATLDSMRKMGKSIFGSGFLLSSRAAAERAAAERAAAERAAAERAAAERAAAERAAAERWPLSERELGIVAALGTAAEKGNY